MNGNVITHYLFCCELQAEKMNKWWSCFPLHQCLFVQELSSRQEIPTAYQQAFDPSLSTCGAQNKQICIHKSPTDICLIC